MTSVYWDEKVSQVEQHIIKGWLDWQFIEDEYIRPQVSGDRNIYYLSHFLNTHLKSRPVEHALSLGCGGGNLERALIKLDAARKIDAFDVSVESIRLAQSLAEQDGMGTRIYYAVKDINHLTLQPSCYDFVIIKMALHHFERLEHLYTQIARSLKPGGVLVFNEFIGPSRYQWTNLQLELMNNLLAAMPRENTRSAWTKDYLTQITRPTVADMIAMDPSEAVRSSDIMPVLRHYFDVVEYKPYGGTILHILLNHIMHTFDLENAEHVALLRSMFLFEKTLTQHNVIPSDFAYVVARPWEEHRAMSEARASATPSVVDNAVESGNDAESPEAQAVRRKITEVVRWYHQIELYPGIVTPGNHNSSENLRRFDSLGLPKDANGLRVLDIGCADGYYSFEMERRGAAEVVAIDYRQPTASGFSVASSILGSNVKYYVDNVYDLSPEKYGTFDLVLFFGVLYHLRNPLLGLDRVRAMLKPGGTVIIETQLLENATLMPDGTLSRLQDISPDLLEMPLWQYYPHGSLNGDMTTKWAPNMAGLKAVVGEAQFHVEQSAVFGARGMIRAEGTFNKTLNYYRVLDSGTSG